MNNKPKDAQCFIEGLYFKIGFRNYVYYHHPVQGWLRSNSKTVKQIQSRINFERLKNQIVSK